MLSEGMLLIEKLVSLGRIKACGAFEEVNEEEK
jgi:hypothetical protein